MNKTIKALNKKLDSAKADIGEIEAKLQLAWDKIFVKNKAIKEAVIKVESSQEYGYNGIYEEIYSWVRFDAADFKDSKVFFKNYMREYHFIEVDFDNDALMLNLGPNIIVCDDGSVYDQDARKTILTKDDYRDDDGQLDYDRRNALIEKYMEETGCFPGVFSMDRYGNVFPVKTQKEKVA